MLFVSHSHITTDNNTALLQTCDDRFMPPSDCFVSATQCELTSDHCKVCVAEPETVETGNMYLKVLHLCAGLELHLKEQILSHQALQEALNDPKNGESAFKHLKQQVWSLLY